MRRVVVAFDSFKGTLSSREANAAFSEGVRDIISDADIVAVAISDGGEGFSEAIVESVGGNIVEVLVSDPLCRPIMARYAIVDNCSTAVITLASASGLTLLTPTERNPLLATTYGTGELVLDAVRRGCRRIVLGLGGSATCDAGVGLLRALGFVFQDAEGRVLTSTMDILERCATINGDGVCSALHDINIAVAIDVDNPLYGERGAAYVYAPQKGASVADVERLDRALRHYADMVACHVGTDYAEELGMGAAGGVAFGLRALLGVVPTSGIEFMLGIVDFDTLLVGADLVVTGEGRVDRQTVMGKAPSGVLRAAKRAGVRCVAVGGSVAWCDELSHSDFDAIYAATPADMLLIDAMKRDIAYDNLRAVGRRVCNHFLGKEEV